MKQQIIFKDKYKFSIPKVPIINYTPRSRTISKKKSKINTIFSMTEDEIDNFLMDVGYGYNSSATYLQKKYIIMNNFGYMFDEKKECKTYDAQMYDNRQFLFQLGYTEAFVMTNYQVLKTMEFVDDKYAGLTYEDLL